MKSGMRIGSRLLLLAVATTIVVAAGVFWQGMRSVEALFTENQRLHESLARLQDESVLGYLWLVSRSTNENGAETTVVWMEPAADAPETTARVDTFTVSGRVIYLDGFMIRFPGKMVADGSARALFLWRRAFGDDQAPNSGVPLDEGEGAPARYANLFREAFSPPQAERFWDALWSLAHDRNALADLQIEALYGNALAIEPRPGFIYTVKLSASGSLSMLTAPLDAVSAPPNLPHGDLPTP